MKVGIVASRFNEIIVNKLLGGAVDGLVRHGVEDENITAAWVPGAFEIPTAVANGGIRRCGDSWEQDPERQTQYDYVRTGIQRDRTGRTCNRSAGIIWCDHD